MNSMNPDPNVQLASITDTLPSIQDTANESISEDSNSNILKIIIMTVILATLGINILLYLFEQTDIVSKYMSEGMVGIIRSIQKIFSGSLKSSSKIIDQSSGTNSYTENHKLNEAVNKPNLQTNNKNEPKPDMSTESSVQNPKNTQWCYIGKDRTYRSCVKMSSGDRCISGEIFPTKDVCINTNLRHNV